MKLLRFLAVAHIVLGCVSITGNLPVRRGVPIASVEVVQAGNVLWRIESTTPEPQIELRYGVVPAGFTQVVPVGRVPRALVPGEHLTLRYTYADSRIELEAKALTPTGVQATGVSSTIPPK